jgi:hypothetical protein
MPSALEGEALAIDDYLVNASLIELKKKGRQWRHCSLQEKLLGSGTSPATTAPRKYAA